MWGGVAREGNGPVGVVDVVDGYAADLFGGGAVEQGQQPDERLVGVHAVVGGHRREQGFLLVEGEAGASESPRLRCDEVPGGVDENQVAPGGVREELAEPG